MNRLDSAYWPQILRLWSVQILGIVHHNKCPMKQMFDKNMFKINYTNHIIHIHTLKQLYDGVIV
jgi:hypothetical protein